MPDAASTPICPWCSEPLSAAEAVECPNCGAHLVGEDVEVPGVTAVDPTLARAAAAPMKVKRTFGSLLVRDDNEIPPPTEAEMPALASPDADVRREMLRLELEARLADLQAEARLLEAEGHPVSIAVPSWAPGLSPDEAASSPDEAASSPDEREPADRPAADEDGGAPGA